MGNFSFNKSTFRSIFKASNIFVCCTKGKFKKRKAKNNEKTHTLTQNVNVNQWKRKLLMLFINFSSGQARIWRAERWDTNRPWSGIVRRGKSFPSIMERENVFILLFCTFLTWIFKHTHILSLFFSSTIFRQRNHFLKCYELFGKGIQHNLFVCSKLCVPLVARDVPSMNDNE
jgi:hypothetical protein